MFLSEYGNSTGFQYLNVFLLCFGFVSLLPSCLIELEKVLNVAGPETAQKNSHFAMQKSQVLMILQLSVILFGNEVIRDTHIRQKNRNKTCTDLYGVGFFSLSVDVG